MIRWIRLLRYAMGLQSKLKELELEVIYKLRRGELDVKLYQVQFWDECEERGNLGSQHMAFFEAGSVQCSR